MFAPNSTVLNAGPGPSRVRTTSCHDCRGCLHNDNVHTLLYDLFEFEVLDP